MWSSRENSGTYGFFDALAELGKLSLASILSNIGVYAENAFPVCRCLYTTGDRRVKSEPTQWLRGRCPGRRHGGLKSLLLARVLEIQE